MTDPVVNCHRDDGLAAVKPCFIREGDMVQVDAHGNIARIR